LGEAPALKRQPIYETIKPVPARISHDLWMRVLPLGQAAQRKHRYFRWTAIANWQDHRSESARDIHLRVPAPSKSSQHSTPRPAGAPLLGTPGNLTAVSMATENKIDTCPRGASQNDWVMRQQQFYFIIARAGQS